MISRRLTETIAMRLEEERRRWCVETILRFCDDVDTTDKLIETCKALEAYFIGDKP